MSSSSASSSRESSAEPAAARGTNVAGAGRNEGVNPHWKLQPPAGAELAGRDANFGALDWDAVCDDDDVELWLVRAPSGVRTPVFLGYPARADAEARGSSTPRISSRRSSVRSPRQPRRARNASGPSSIQTQRTMFGRSALA
jgi:hypothetical protein